MCDCLGNTEDCAGICGGDTVIDECGICGGSGVQDGACDCEGNIEDCEGVCGGNSETDECGICNGNGASCGANGTVYLSYYETTEGTMEVFYESDQDIAGYQFQVSGVLLSNAYGGITEETGFTMHFSDAAFVAFSLTGNNIPSGSGILLNLDYMSISDEACISQTIFGNIGGEPMLINNENCAELIYTEVLGCMDLDACNYNFEANNDDGSCYYSEPNYDCDGNCIAEFDCEGICGGVVFEDDCGICGGDGYSCQECDELSEYHCDQSPYCDWTYEMISCSDLSPVSYTHLRAHET